MPYAVASSGPGGSVSRTAIDPRLASSASALQWNAGALTEAPDWIAEPYRLQLEASPAAAADAWRARKCPYEAARALAESEDQELLLEALGEFERLGAQPAAKLLRQTLRARGAAVPRGPRPATRANPAELTSRELEVLRLVAAGMRNADVANELVLSSRTVDHHVSAILRKLRVKTRGEAAAEATRLGLLEAV
jgi:ATP/maltotriose-dependent transcriptional regulator MalT